MAQTILRKILIEIDDDVFRCLSIKAVIAGKNLKKYIEDVLRKDVEDLYESEMYKQLCKAKPEGNVMLNEKEQTNFENWLGVSEK